MDWIGDAWDAVYGWFDGLSAEEWSALGTWVAVIVALVTVIVGGKYAAQQVAEARRTREEQAQPNVVTFMESNHAVWQMMELVVKNFGTTPAYGVQLEFDSDPKVSPASDSEAITDLDYPKLIPILAPWQEWRTFWDFAPKRMATEGLATRHKATVHYKDSRDKAFTTEAILDWETLIGTKRVGTKSIHDLTKLVEEKLQTQNKVLDGIGRVLAEYATEHQGIWVYGSNDAREREYRAEQRRQEAERRGQEMRHIDQLLGRNRADSRPGGGEAAAPPAEPPSQPSSTE